MSRDGWSKKRANASDDNGWGGYMAAKVSKLDEQFRLAAPREKQKEGTWSNIFSGVAIYVNGYTEPSADELRRLMMLHGGQFHVYYSRSKTTHIIANNLPNSKIQELKGEKVIRPEWITDSIKAGCLLPYLQYQLYAKHKGPLFPVISRHQTSETAGPSRGPLQASVHQKINLPLCNVQHSLPNDEQSSSINLHTNKSSLSHRNGLLQTSLDVMSHSKMTKVRECGRKDPFLQVVKEAPLTNGHTHLVNGALKPEDLSSITDERCVDKELSECKLKSSEAKPISPPVQFQTKPDPYEFPHSPPKQPHQSSHSAASRSFLHSPIRLNGSYHNAFSSDSASFNTANITADPDPSTDKSASSLSSSKSSAQLLAQTGDMISEYYSHSRLHQISTWRTGFSEYVNELHSKRKAAGGFCFPGKDRLRKCVAQRSTDRKGTSVKSCILHVDMDCFFVSVGIRNRPDLKGKPVAVTSNRGQGRVPLRPGANPQAEQQYYQRKQTHPQPGESYPACLSQSPDSHAKVADQDAALSMAEIASCSYEARQAGVRNGMFFGKAKQLCPSLQSVPYDFEAYKEVALTMYEILAGYTHDIEALSCDEVLIDGSALIAELGINPEDLAKTTRADIKEKTGCCASVGMGSNILLARLATRKAKPDGQYFLKSEEVDDFIRDLPVTSLPGVGPVMSRKLAAMGVRSCGDLQQVSLSQLQKKFGPRTGQTLFRFCRGLDDRPVRYEKERKSVSAGMNYNIRFAGIDEAECFLTNLSMEVQRRLREAGVRGRRVTLKVMVRKVGAPLEPAKYGGHGICDNLAKTVMLAQCTDSGQLIAAAVIKLLHAMKLQVQDLRGVGILVQLLEGHHSVPQDSTGSRTLPGTSTDQQTCRQTPKHSRTRLNLSIEVPSPSQVDHSVLEALPAELREQPSVPLPQPPSPNPGIVLELPNLSQVDPDVFAALPKELQEELKSAYNRATAAQPQAKIFEQKNALLQLKQSGVGIGRVKRRYKRKNLVSPVKKGQSPLKRHQTSNSPAKNLLPLKKSQEPVNTDIPECKFIPRPPPSLAGACDLTDIKTLLREWVTTITEPMEEDILQVVKYCTDLIEDKDLEKLDLIIKYMKRLMQQSVESVWSMAFDFILDNVQVVVQQAYGSTLKIA
uniref:DNA repair protein REV1 n=1 Tax=Mastacembelus armatus TaxID=205130 RepID=A0A7N8WMY3_9TELE